MKTKTLKATIATALLVVAAVPASSLGATKFGAELTPDTQPSNSSIDGAPCEFGNAGLCTRVSMEAYGRPDGGEVAPKDGTIKKISVISQGPDTFRFELAKAKPDSETAKVVYRSQKLHSQGQADPNADTYTIETFKVDAQVKKGMYLATESKRSSMLRCSSGGPNQLLFQPALPFSGPFETATGTDGCWLLLEATIR
ncbi:MAG: hypothetical protein QOI10_1114 [Solirubrobacterales bacterium]|jgi:hypothetical protein|nr:hypothetical protein [Solirubrobacterales bacterium]